MIYGNMFLPKHQEVEKVNMFAIESVVFDEYCNRVDLLESCTDKSARPLLEAQVQVLQEISFKDIIEKIKEAWENLKKWVIDVWNSIFHNSKAVSSGFEKTKQETVNTIKSVQSELNTNVSTSPSSYSVSSNKEEKT